MEQPVKEQVESEVSPFIQNCEIIKFLSESGEVVKQTSTRAGLWQAFLLREQDGWNKSPEGLHPKSDDSKVSPLIAYKSLAFGLCTSQQNTTIQQWKQQHAIHRTVALYKQLVWHHFAQSKKNIVDVMYLLSPKRRKDLIGLPRVPNILPSFNKRQQNLNPFIGQSAFCLAFLIVRTGPYQIECLCGDKG